MNSPYFPVNYNPYNTQPIVQRKAELIQGRTAAEAYPVYAGEEVFLIDMDNPYIYRKARGFDNILEPLEVYDLVKHTEEPQEPKVDLSAYMTAEQVEKRINEEVDRRLSELSFKPTPKRRKEIENE